MERRTPDISDKAEQRLTKLLGDSERAKCKVERLKSITSGLIEADLKAEAEIFKALADPCRLKILKLLKEGELCACEIVTALNRPQSSTSHHLTVLKESGLIKERKEGKWSKYRLADGAVIEIMNQVQLLK